MAKFRARATMSVELELEIEANSQEEAWEIARNTDGGDFAEIPNSGDWNLHDCYKMEEKASESLSGKLSKIQNSKTYELEILSDEKMESFSLETVERDEINEVLTGESIVLKEGEDFFELVELANKISDENSIYFNEFEHTSIYHQKLQELIISKLSELDETKISILDSGDFITGLLDSEETGNIMSDLSYYGHHNIISLIEGLNDFNYPDAIKKEDVIFYQPAYDESYWDQLNINSFDVWASKEACQEEFPNIKIEKFNYEEIEHPDFIDIKNPTFNGFNILTSDRSELTIENDIKEDKSSDVLDNFNEQYEKENSCNKIDIS